MKTMRNCSSSSSYIFVISTTPVRKKTVLFAAMNPVPHFEIKVCKKIFNIFIETIWFFFIDAVL